MTSEKSNNSDDLIRNRVDESGIITIDMEQFHIKGERVLLDLKPLLFEGMILKEKDFRSFVKDHSWNEYQDKFVAVTCSTEAIIPVWAYMLIGSELAPFSKKTVFGSLEQLDRALFSDAIKKMDTEAFIDKRVVLKGCGDIHIPESAFMDLTSILRPMVKSIMYGEPCSSVPVYKRKK